MIKDINPGPQSAVHGATYEDWLHNIAPVDDTLFFTADDGVRGRELWKTDGTAVGTTRLTLLPDHHAGPDYYLPTQVPVRKLTRVGKTLYFVADDGDHGGELWSSNGTRSGTRLAADISRGVGDGSPLELQPFRGTLFFSAHNGSEWGLWKVTRR